MDWQTKEHIDSRLDDLELKLDLIMNHFQIKDESLNDYEDEEELDSDDSKEINL